MSDAQSNQGTLDTLTIQMLQNLGHLNMQQQQTELSLKVGAIKSDLQRAIILAYIQAEKNTLSLIEDHLNGK